MYGVSVNRPRGERKMEITTEGPRDPGTDPRVSPEVRPDQRFPRLPLTRQRIIRAALRVMDEEGLEAVTMRRIGRELGVEAMSLYNHVRDKEDIFDGITETVLGGLRVPTADDWAESARLTAREFRRVLL